MTQKELIDFCNEHEFCDGKYCSCWIECGRYVEKYGTAPYLEDNFSPCRYTDEEI